MVIKSLRVWNFRNLHNSNICFSPSVNLITGLNGQGKTNLIEALYCTSFGKSFRTRRLAHCIKFGADRFLIGCEITGEKLTNRIEISKTFAGKKAIRLNGKRAFVSDLLNTVSSVCITASHLRIVNGGPEERRKLFDGFIALLDPSYLHDLTKYRRIIKHKNILLKNGETIPEQITAWNMELVHSAEHIVKKRMEFVKEFSLSLKEDIFSHQPLELIYVPSIEFGLLSDKSRALKWLTSMLSRERKAQRCLVGPHLDEFKIMLNDKETRTFASSGQKRSVLLSIYFQYLEEFRDKKGFYPVVMIDDADAELDLERIHKLITFLIDKTQIFITSAKSNLFTELVSGGGTFLVSEGMVSNL